MEYELDPITKLETLVSPLFRGGFLGIDIGSSSIKIAQVSVRDDGPVLDTYGEVELGPYGDREARRIAHLDSQRRSAALLDLIHDVDASARRGGVGIPLPSTLVSFVELPKRDPEQMRRLLASEAKQYIPVPVESVLLDWMVVDEGRPQEDAFTRAKAEDASHPQLQEVMLVAIEKDAVNAYAAALKAAAIAADFYEVEIFGAIRSSVLDSKIPALVIDLGASTTKLCVVNGRGVPLGTHIVDSGGEVLTEKIMQACGWSFEKAEEAKRAGGLTGSPSCTESENAKMKDAIAPALTDIFKEGSRLVRDSANKREVDVGRIVLSGGGACMPGIAEHAAAHFKTEVKLARPFAKTKAPMIIEDALQDVGPKFAIAVGLALRGLQK